MGPRRIALHLSIPLGYARQLSRAARVAHRVPIRVPRVDGCGSRERPCGQE